jgi:predicted RNase H-like HicB family nuclease
MKIVDKLEIEFDREVDGRWIAEVAALPGVLAYGSTENEARRKIEYLAGIVTAERALETSRGGPPWKPTKPRN